MNSPEFNDSKFLPRREFLKTNNMPEIGSQKKRDIAMAIVLFLDRDKKYSAQSIERIIVDNVRPVILAQQGFAPDHIRRAMIENGYVERDPATNETWIAPDFVGLEDTHQLRITRLRNQLHTDPESSGRCPECSIELKVATLLNHYLKKHAATERWEQILDQYFGYN